jgi:hypothetical protein
MYHYSPGGWGDFLRVQPTRVCETVKTVFTHLFVSLITGLKPGVNESEQLLSLR